MKLNFFYKKCPYTFSSFLVKFPHKNKSRAEEKNVVFIACHSKIDWRYRQWHTHIFFNSFSPTRDSFHILEPFGMDNFANIHLIRSEKNCAHHFTIWINNWPLRFPFDDEKMSPLIYTFFFHLEEQIWEIEYIIWAGNNITALHGKKRCWSKLTTEEVDKNSDVHSDTTINRMKRNVIFPVIQWWWWAFIYVHLNSAWSCNYANISQCIQFFQMNFHYFEYFSTLSRSLWMCLFALYMKRERHYSIHVIFKNDNLINIRHNFRWAAIILSNSRQLLLLYVLLFSTINFWCKALNISFK